MPPRARTAGNRLQGSHQIPPAPEWPRDGWSLLDGPFGEDLSLLLWLRARSVRLWAVVPEDSRSGLFATPRPSFSQWEDETAAEFPEIATALRTLGALVRYPELISAAHVVASCREISAWGDERGSLDVAVEFAEGAALADGETAQTAADAGHLSTRAAAYHRAWLWLMRSVAVARRTRDWEWYVRAHIRFGIMLYELGEHAKARPHYWRATRAALNSGRRTLAGKAQHDLLLIEAEAGSYLSGEKCARRVLEYYPRRYERIPHFVHDYAYLLVRHFLFAHALPLVEAVLPLINKPYERVAVLATLARAAAGAGERGKYEAASHEVVRIVAETDVNAAAALVATAEGAAVWGEWEKASCLALQARELAERRREGDPLRRALVLMARIDRREAPEAEQPPPCLARIDETSAACLNRLGAQRAPAPGMRARRVVTAGMAVSTASSP